MRRGEERGLEQHRRHSVGAVFVILAALILHHVALNVQLALGQDFQQKAHPVRLQPQRQLKAVGRDVLPVVGSVRRGGAVEIRADLLKRVEVAGVVVLRPLEHDVFEKVGEPRLAGLFVLRADVIPHVDRRHGQRPVLGQYHVQAVGEGEFFVVY